MVSVCVCVCVCMRAYFECVCVCVTHQHSSSKVKLVKELSDKDVCLHQVVLVSILDIPDDLRKPLPLLLSTGHPDEKHLAQI